MLDGPEETPFQGELADLGAKTPCGFSKRRPTSELIARKTSRPLAFLSVLAILATTLGTFLDSFRACSYSLERGPVQPPGPVMRLGWKRVDVGGVSRVLTSRGL